MADAWNWAVARYSDKRLFATRDILGEEDEIQPNGKLFRKLGTLTDRQASALNCQLNCQLLIDKIL